MIIVSLRGGLGNQMFQYAMGRRLAYMSRQAMKLDLEFLNSVRDQSNVTARNYELSILNVKEDFASDHDIKKCKNLKTKILNKFFPAYHGNPFVKENFFHFDPSILSLSGERYLFGHWMSEKYFMEIESVIRSEFTFKKEILDEGKTLHAKILNTNSVCMQVRRGDYISNPEIAKIHQTTSLNYFEQAAALIRLKIENPVFFIFSDDIAWCEENLKGLGNVYFVERELSKHGASNSDYLQMMIACKHFVISNSTFAWWAAWLSTSTDKIVVAPMNWFNDKKINTRDIYPSSWLRI